MVRVTVGKKGYVFVWDGSLLEEVGELAKLSAAGGAAYQKFICISLATNYPCLYYGTRSTSLASHAMT